MVAIQLDKDVHGDKQVHDKPDSCHGTGCDS